MNLGTQKRKKARANFAGVRDAAGRSSTACTQACSSQGRGSTPWACMWQRRPRHACKGRGMLAWARWHAPGCRQQGPWWHAAMALACTLPERPWQHGEGIACPVGGMRRPWHAPWVGCRGCGMPLGPLQGHGSTWGDYCCQA